MAKKTENIEDAAVVAADYAGARAALNAQSAAKRAAKQAQAQPQRKKFAEDKDTGKSTLPAQKTHVRKKVFVYQVQEIMVAAGAKPRKRRIEMPERVSNARLTEEYNQAMGTNFKEAELCFDLMCIVNN